MNFSPDSKFTAVCVRLVELTKINLLWLLCSLPVFTVGASTCAMLACLSAMKQEEDCGGKAFFRFFRLHFGKATVLWLLVVFLGAMLALDYWILAPLEFPGKMAAIVVVCFCAFGLILVSGLIFPLLVRYRLSIADTVINAVLLSVAHLPKMLLVTAMNLLPVLLLIVLPQVFFFLSFLLPICGIALIALYDLQVTGKIFDAVDARQEETKRR